ncbi:MAG: putative toxin-antitoxin system toxin component, PIN family [bacterium]
MIVCIDTNTLVQALATHHPFFPILSAWVEGRINLAVSSGILLEYEEVITRLCGLNRWRKLSRLMDLAELTDGNLLRVTPYYQFRIIRDDPDDNLFADCAISAGADFIITEDKHFAPLTGSGYKPRPISPQEFIARHPAIWL